MIDDSEAQQFFSAIEPVAGSEGDITFNYLSLLIKGQNILFRGRLFFNNGKTDGPFTHIETKHIRAGQYRLSELGYSAREIATQLMKGTVKTPHGDLHFPIDGHGNTHVRYHPYHPEGLKKQSRFNILHIANGTVPFDATALDWELKGAPTPFDSLQELMAHYTLGPLTDTNINFEFVAFNMIVVDTSSNVTGTLAELKVALVEGLPTSKASMGYRVQSNGQVVERATVPGNAMNWETNGVVQRGSAKITVPEAAVVECIACYDGSAHSTYWIADSANFQNPRRSAYDVFDGNLEALRDFLQRGPGKGNARDLETGVSWLMWMLGFSVAHLGATAKTQDGADLIATTPSGNFAVIECTTHLLKAENKLPRLVLRTSEVKARLDKSNNRHLQVIPIMITSRTREEIAADLDQAERLGVLVITKENLEEAINRTMLIPDADQYYRQAEEAVRAGKEKHGLEKRLDLAS